MAKEERDQYKYSEGESWLQTYMKNNNYELIDLPFAYYFQYMQRISTATLQFLHSTEHFPL